MNEIKKSIDKLRRARMLEVQRVMQEYDRTVFYPALAELKARCKEQGHVKGNWDNNGLGWSWFYCTICGTRLQITGPDGQVKDED